MVRIAPVTLSNNPKTLWFDAGDITIHEGDNLVVSTARGTEFGRAAGEVFEASSEQVDKLKTPLKPVKRVATSEDEANARVMERKAAEALPVFKEMAAEMGDDMRPVSVEYLLDGDKAVFYFEAEDRVDFRELVRKLAARFHVRIDMRQIGVRDEARMIGGLGHCGQELCCKRLGGEFCPVSIRMAKEQDLSLNPQKISGVCGRLMCCLRYEYDAYKDFNKRAPKRNATVQTPVGPAKVVDLDVPREIVTVRVEGEKPVKVPLADFDEPQGEGRPNVIGEEAWECAIEQGRAALGSASSSLLTGQLTAGDKLADPQTVRHTGSASAGRKQRDAAASRPGSQKQRSKSQDSSKGSSKSSSSAKTPVHKRASSQTRDGAVANTTSTRTPRRRRSTKLDASGVSVTTQAPVSRSHAAAETSAAGKGAAGTASAKKREGAGGSQARKGSQGKKQGAQQGQRKQTAASATSVRGGAQKGGAEASRQSGKTAVRPGQNSSGVRGLRNASTSREGAHTDTHAAPRDGHAPADAQKRAGAHRRRRNRKSSGETPQQQ
ncbi:PSP1 domain-containing protein [Adlercreutzia sp. ZJ141]|uniref:PSP1 domain-containing protein n=1 Tax=Adlercreutzia sp. ZJ141 TaxID=2709406 RepID=UPI0013ED40B9|nr:regulatory iron-sulfur-containing complex subunit RicT [Adlercreutzia sp. ZJ141]